MIYNKSLLEFEQQKEMILDNVRSEIIVVPVNMKGLFFDKVGRRLETSFPNVVKQYRKDLLNEKVFPGDALLYEDNGYKVVLLIGEYIPYGKDRDDIATVGFFITEAINEMVKRLGTDKVFSSGAISSGSIWKEVKEHIRSLNVKWRVLLD